VSPLVPVTASVLLALPGPVVGAPVELPVELLVEVGSPVLLATPVDPAVALVVPLAPPSLSLALLLAPP